MEEVKFEFEFGLADAMAFHEYFTFENKAFKRAQKITALSLPVVFAYIFLLDLIDGGFDGVLGLIFLVISTVWIVFYPRRRKSMVSKRILKQLDHPDSKSMYTRQEFTLSEEGVFMKTKETEYLIRWEGIKRVVINEDYFFLYNTGSSAVIFPKDKLGGMLPQVEQVIKEKVGHLILESV